MAFPETIAEHLAGRSVRMAGLAFFDFASGPVRAWEGFGRLRTQDSNEWIGAGGMGKIGEITAAINATAPEQTFTLSGIDAEFGPKALADYADYYNRLVFLYFQFFTPTWQCLDLPCAISWWRMRDLVPAKAVAEDGRGSVYSITLAAESVFGSRRRPRFGFYTDADQQRRYPGDRGCERVAGIQNKLVTFPDY